jgi:hypothetical protein
MVQQLTCRLGSFARADGGRLVLVFPRVDKETDNSFFAERLGGFQPVQTFDQHKASAVRPYKDRRLLALIEDARRDFVYALLIKSGALLNRHVDVRDRDGLALHHAGFTAFIGSSFSAHLFSVALT